MLDHVYLQNNKVIDKCIVPAPRRNRPDKKETRYVVMCCGCKKLRLLSLSDLKKDTFCRTCASVLASKITSTWEDEVSAYLRSKGISYEQHYPILELGSNVDFFLPDYNWFIEVRGYWHLNHPRRQVHDEVLASNLPVLFIDNLDQLKDIERVILQ